MSPFDRLENSLRSQEPARALRAIVLDLSQAGHSKAEIYQALEDLLSRLRARQENQSSSDDAVLDVMDALSGWCHPTTELLPDNKPL